jgi:hypothetical protein
MTQGNQKRPAIQQTLPAIVHKSALSAVPDDICAEVFLENSGFFTPSSTKLLRKNIKVLPSPLPRSGMAFSSRHPGSSSFLMLMAKSEIRGISVEETIENLVCQPAGRRENDFAISIVFGD